jgi:hypothetical protein
MSVSHGEGDGVLPQPPVYAERDRLKKSLETIRANAEAHLTAMAATDLPNSLMSICTTLQLPSSTAKPLATSQ